MTLLVTQLAPITVYAEPVSPPPSFKKVFIVVLENTDYKDAVVQPFMSRVAGEGALLENLFAVARPSQPNYLALTSGSTWNVATNGRVNLEARHIGDLLEAKGLSWKVYADGYPGNCFLGSSKGKYVRKHVPFLSYKNVQSSPERCARVVSSSELAQDVEKGALADYSLYIPDDDNNGHDTSVAYADRFLEKTFGPLLKDERFTRDMLFIVTFDESSYLSNNRVFTAFWGASVKPGTRSTVKYSLYSILRTIEDALGLGTLGKNDATASPISDVWRD